MAYFSVKNQKKIFEWLKKKYPNKHIQVNMESLFYSTNNESICQLKIYVEDIHIFITFDVPKQVELWAKELS